MPKSRRCEPSELCVQGIIGGICDSIEAAGIHLQVARAGVNAIYVDGVAVQKPCLQSSSALSIGQWGTLTIDQLLFAASLVVVIYV